VTKILLAILTLAAAWSASPEAMAQPLRTVAFIDAVKYPAKAKQAHGHLRASLEEAFSPKSWFLAETSQPIEDCGSTPDCMAKVAGDLKTQYVLRIAGQKSQEYAYEITLDVYSAALAGTRGSLATCDICDPGRMAEVASKAAVDLLASVAKEEASAREQAKRAATAPPVVAPDPGPPPVAIVTPPPVVEPANRAWMPWTLVGVGLATAGYGVWAIHEDGDKTGSCSPARAPTTCDHYSSMGRGVVSTVAGAALVAGGVIWFIAMPTHSTAVSLSPNHVALNVRF